ncbi:hypothetical protein HanPI659440_Chr11g0427301 [Helianthus annuus]|nr:hypothetical protein HanPI659440_Chr11g0427301 [Helianthus annuus]
MIAEKLVLVNATIFLVLYACASITWLDVGHEIDDLVKNNSLVEALLVGHTTVAILVKGGHIIYAQAIFNETSKRYVVTGTSRIYVLDKEAIFLFKELRLKGVLPNEETLKCVLPAYAITTNLQQVPNFHGNLIRSGLLSNSDLAIGVTDIYSKCGASEQAYMTFLEAELKEKDILLYIVIVILSGYGKSPWFTRSLHEYWLNHSQWLVTCYAQRLHRILIAELELEHAIRPRTLLTKVKYNWVEYASVQKWVDEISWFCLELNTLPYWRDSFNSFWYCNHTIGPCINKY